MESYEAQPNFHSMQASPVNDNLLAVGLSSSWAAVADMRVPGKSSLVVRSCPRRLSCVVRSSYSGLSRL